MYRNYLKVIRRQELIALKVPVSKQNKIRALIMMICPRLIPWAMVMRRKKYNADVTND